MFRKLLAGLFGVVVLIAIGLATWEPLMATAVTPPPAHRYDTVIVRDRYGVPHIFGKTDPDVTYGVAYAHAEDDFATLQEAIAMVRGRLGAMTGADGAKVDYTLHLLGARATAHRDYLKQPADVRALLDADASGLNLSPAATPAKCASPGCSRPMARTSRRGPCCVPLLLMEWARGRPVASQSIQPFGAATTRPTSPHYADQAPLFVAHQLKPVWFWRDQLRGNVERVHRP